MRTLNKFEIYQTLSNARLDAPRKPYNYLSRRLFIGKNVLAAGEEVACYVRTGAMEHPDKEYWETIFSQIREVGIPVAIASMASTPQKCEEVKSFFALLGAELISVAEWERRGGREHFSEPLA